VGVVRHFLACCSVDATGQEVIVDVTIAGERFYTKGTTITDLGFMHVYTYQKWHGRTIPQFEMNQTFTPDEIRMNGVCV